MNTIFINGLKIQTLIGIYPWEKQIPQTLLFDLSLKTDFTPLLETGDLNHGISYAELNQSLQQHLAEQQFDLLEQLANHCVNWLKEKYPVTQISLTITKPTAGKDCNAVGVCIVDG